MKLLEHHDYIRETLEDWSIPDTHHLLTTYYDVDISLSAFISYIYKNKLKKRTSIKWTPELIKFVENNLHYVNKDLARILSEKLKTDIGVYQANNIRQWVRKKLNKQETPT